ncbi:metallophosphoesterase [Humisphaera borealis]|uniref:Metallophosphoesterase n=1 Tax=Humisphaera borealis TaxID=2807512 RepID=A0A7M2WS27_9BACT|nr:metallophosphoesterase [Humisphaera borealis]QOV88243.1 metallophosphoesterase [Humisphaera borealis]
MAAFWFIIAFMFAGNVGWWLWADRRLRPLPVAPLWRSLLGLFIGLQLAYLVFFFIAPSTARRAHYYVPQDALGVFYLWCLIVLPTTVLLTLLVNGGRWGFRILGGGGKHAGPRLPSGGPPREPKEGHGQEYLPMPPEAQQSAPSLSRRQLLAAATVAIPPLLVGTGVVYGRHSIYDLRVRRVDLAVPQLPYDLNGLTIAHLSDIHVGKFVDERYLRHVREMTNALHADLHLMTGDLIDLAISDLPGALDFVTSLDPKHGLLMCEGNHDLIEDGPAFYSGTRRRGVPLLLDGGKAVRLPGRSSAVRILGLRWGGTGAGSPADEGFSRTVEQLTASKQPEEFPILLAHHPHAFDAAAAAGIPLTLAGHTHGGLLMLSERVGPAALMYRYFSGLYRKSDSHLFVSNGVGSWYPVRVNAQPEIVHFTLRSV